MKNIKCLSCKFYYLRPSFQNYNFSLCTKYNTFSVISRQDTLLCGPNYKHYEKVNEMKPFKIEPVDKPVDKPVKSEPYIYDKSYEYIMSQIHI